MSEPIVDSRRSWEQAVADLDPLPRALAELHTPGERAWVECAGCDFSGWEGEPPTWPCRTASLVLGYLGLTEADIRTP